MDASAKVIAVKGQTLLKLSHGLLEVFHLLMRHAEEEECLWLRRTLYIIISLNFNRFLKRCNRFAILTMLMENLGY